MVVDALLCRGEEEDAMWSLIEEERVKRRKEMKIRKEKRREEEGESLIACKKDELCTRACDCRSKGKKHREQEWPKAIVITRSPFSSVLGEKSVAGLNVCPHPVSARPASVQYRRGPVPRDPQLNGPQYFCPIPPHSGPFQIRPAGKPLNCNLFHFLYE